MADVVDGYTATLNRVADKARRDVAAIFDSIGTYDETTALLYVEAAGPVVEGYSQAALNLTAAYMEEVGVTPDIRNDDLIVADANSRILDPFDRLGADLASGMAYSDALDGARSQAEVTGVDAIFRTARNGMAEYGLPLTDWKRRLGGAGCCQWCMKLSSVIFDSAAQATFGHAHCRCIPVPNESVGDHNEAIKRAEGFDPTAEKLWSTRKERARLRRTIDSSETRATEARRNAETIPQRRGLENRRADNYDAKAAMARRKLELLEAPV